LKPARFPVIIKQYGGKATQKTMTSLNQQASGTAASAPELTAEAVARWRENIRKHTFSNYHLRMGMALRREDPTAAAAAYRRALDIDPALWVAHLHLVRELERGGRPDAAEEAHRHALALAPDYRDRAELAETLMAVEDGEFETAEPALRRALAERPERAADATEAFSALAAYHESRGAYAAAVDWLERLAAESTVDPTVFYRLGRAYVAAQRHADAGNALRRATAANPDDADVRHQICYLSLVSMRPEAALRAERQSVALRPPSNSFSEYWHMAHAAICLRRFDEALGLARRAVQTAPDAPLAHGALGLAFTAADRINEAATAFRAAVSKSAGSPDAWVLAGAAMVDMRKGATAEALAGLTRAAALERNVNWVQSALAYLLLRQGDKERGLAALRAGYEAEPHMAGFELWSRPWMIAVLQPAYAEIGVHIAEPSDSCD
jgi:tetratricopeptide (TPR) repeat protein